jgi:hypothetical protein
MDGKDMIEGAASALVPVTLALRRAYPAIPSMGALWASKLSMHLAGSRRGSPRGAMKLRGEVVQGREQGVCYHGDRWRTHQRCWTRVCEGHVCRSSAHRRLATLISQTRDLFLS